ncbi:MAG: hypothetical protein Kow0090_08910 [Myxococcota bacterium]
MKKHIVTFSTAFLVIAAALLLFLSLRAAYGTAEYGRRDIKVGIASFDTSELTGDGVSARKTFDFDYDGAIDQIRVYKSGENCDSLEWWVLEDDVSPSTTAKSSLVIVADNEGNPQSQSYANWRPIEGAVIFKSKVANQSGNIIGKLAVEAKAHGGPCNASFKIFGRSY